MSSIIAEFFRSQASWRRKVAEEYPEDGRNLQSAVALEDLADYVEAGDSGQYEAGRPVLDGLAAFGWGEGSLGGEQVARATSRYGYGYETGPSTHDGFLEELVTLCLSDAYDSARDQGGFDPTSVLDPTGVLLPFELDAARDGVMLPERYFERRSHSTEHELEEAVADYRGDSQE